MMYTLKNGEVCFIALRTLAFNRFRKKERSHKNGKILVLLTCTLFLSLLSSAQNISLDFTNVPLAKVLNEIKLQSKYDVFYNQALLRNIKNVTIKAEKEPFQKVLARLFADLPVNYSIANNTIVVMPKEKPRQDPGGIEHLASLSVSGDRAIRGKVVDYKGRPIPGVMVQYDQSFFFTTTNEKGDFTLNSGGNPSGAIITFSGQGYTELEARYNGEGFLLIQMEPQGSNLQNVMVSSISGKKDPTVHIDLANRNYMNLSQILQGTVPGVSLQTVNNTTTTVTSVTVFVNQQLRFVTFTPEQFLRSYPARGQQILDALISGNYPSWLNKDVYRITTTTRVTTTLVPQLRGTNSFAGNLSGMLVVIDGFAKDGFPADFPMNNVESIEIVKDPAELVKWGPRANGGIIMIRTKQGKVGKLQVNYSTNMYYAPAPRFNREKLQLANTSDVMDYVLQVDSTFYKLTSDPNNAFNMPYANYLVNRLRNNIITKGDFDNRWDSLKRLDNESQIRLLQNNAFSQNHNLSITGGSRNYKFSVIGGYTSATDNSLNGSNKTASINMNNAFNLLNDKLNIDLYLYGASIKSRSGFTLNPSSLTLQPYQMLLDNNGNYIYDHSLLNPDANAVLLKNGYLNYGVNLLEDTRLNKFTNNTDQLQTRMNLNWKLLPGLQWTASVYYNTNSNKTDNLYDKQSSFTRQLVNTYGEYHRTGVDFFVPWGNILQRNQSTNKEWNVRSGLSYAKSIGKNDFSISVGAGAASVSYLQPATPTLYGYNTVTKTGAPVFLPSPDPNGAIGNFYALFNGQTALAYPYTLTVPANFVATNSRNINWNASLVYRYNKQFSITGNTTTSLSPNYGQSIYATLSNYKLDATLDVFRKPVNKWLDNLSVSSGMVVNQLPDLPVNYNAVRYPQISWGNYSIWVSNYSPTQQLGQRSQNVYQSVKLTFFQGRYEITAAYNTQSMRGINNSNNSDGSGKTLNSTSALRYASAAMKANLRQGALSMDLNYSKSPEGQSQVNGSARYNLAKESFFHSNIISTLEADMLIQNISPYQGMNLMMGTNVASNGSYSMATNSTFTSLPPKNTNYEVRGRIGLKNDAYLLDLRYYNRTTGGLNSNIATAADVSTGLSGQVAYSSIVNKGLEFFWKTSVVRKSKFTYAVTLNGAYNLNIAKTVPVTRFTGRDEFATSYRDGYSINNIWAYKWAGLDNNGNPQIYDTKGEKTALLDSATLASSLHYAGVLKAPWNGGFIHDFTFGQFFSRVAFTFSWGAVMKRFIPTPSSDRPVSSLIRERWKKPGDELYTDVPAMSAQGAGTYRAFVTNNSDNSIMSADYIRLQEIMFGWRMPQSILDLLKINSAFFTIQVQNLAFWAKNKYKLDPATVSANGAIGLPLPTQYSCTFNVGF